MPIFKRQPLQVKERRFLTNNQIYTPLPDLIEIQKDSYAWFLKTGVKELFDEVSPITDFSGRELELYFEDYYLDEPRFEEAVCRERNITFEAPLRITARLVNKRTGQTKSQEIFLGDIPIMTNRGTFIVNGIERAVVSQLIRSAGVFFTAENIRGRRYYGAKIIPNRGAWLEIETDMNNTIWVKVDRKRKVAVTSLMRAFGHEDDQKIIDLLKDVNIHPTIDYAEATLKKDLAKNTIETVTNKVNAINTFQEEDLGSYPALPKISKWKEDLVLCQLYAYKSQFYNLITGKYPEATNFDELLIKLSQVAPKTDDVDRKFDKSVIKFTNNDKEITFECTDKEDSKTFVFKTPK